MNPFISPSIVSLLLLYHIYPTPLIGQDMTHGQFFKAEFNRFEIRVECSTMVQEIGFQSRVESYQRLRKWYLIPSSLTLISIKYVSRVKWSNPGKGVASSPTPRCISYRKGSLLVTFDYGRQQQYIKSDNYGKIFLQVFVYKFTEYYKKKTLSAFMYFVSCNV